MTLCTVFNEKKLAVTSTYFKNIVIYNDEIQINVSC